MDTLILSSEKFRQLYQIENYKNIPIPALQDLEFQIVQE
jgi:hypothetical protein